MTEPVLVVYPDEITSDRDYVGLVGLRSCRVRAEQFGLIENEDYSYFVKFDQRPVNFSPTLSRDDPATFSALVKKLQGDIKTTSIEQHNMLHYLARLLVSKDTSTGHIAEVLTAPAIGSICRLATDQEAIEFLSLPSIHRALQFGTIFNSTIPLCLSEEVLRHHLLMAGATGQGKTTVSSNIIAAGYELGATVFVFDYKPDYQHIEDISEWRQALGIAAIPRKSISYWNLNVRRPYRKDVQPVNVHFSEIDAGIFAALAAAPGNENMRNSFHDMLHRFAEKMAQMKQKTWSNAEFFAAIPKSKNDPKLRDFYKDGEAPHEATLSVVSRLSRAKPQWVDVKKESRGAFKGTQDTRSFFEQPHFLAPQHIHVIEVTPARERDYGLFLSTLMEKVSAYKEDHQLRHPILIVMDEAEDVFAGTDFATACIREIAGVIRKGRSQKIGVLISVQSAANIPKDIAQNLNSIIAFRHNHEEAAGHIKRLLDKDARNLQSLDTGDAVVRLHRAKVAVRAKLDREAFRLVVSE